MLHRLSQGAHTSHFELSLTWRWDLHRGWGEGKETCWKCHLSMEAMAICWSSSSAFLTAKYWQHTHEGLLPWRRGENKHFALAKKHDRTLSTCILTATDWNNSKVLLLGLNYINNQSINQKERKVERKERRRGKRPIIVTGKVSILGQKVQEEESLPRGTNHL